MLMLRATGEGVGRGMRALPAPDITLMRYLFLCIQHKLFHNLLPL